MSPQKGNNFFYLDCIFLRFLCFNLFPTLDEAFFCQLETIPIIYFLKTKNKTKQTKKQSKQNKKKGSRKKKNAIFRISTKDFFFFNEKKQKCKQNNNSLIHGPPPPRKKKSLHYLSNCSPAHDLYIQPTMGEEC